MMNKSQQYLNLYETVSREELSFLYSIRDGNKAFFSSKAATMASVLARKGLLAKTSSGYRVTRAGTEEIERAEAL